jgi:hypothetical protein
MAFIRHAWHRVWKLLVSHLHSPQWNFLQQSLAAWRAAFLAPSTDPA